MEHIPNDMTYSIKICKIGMYADDHQLFVFGQSLQEVESKLNSDIETKSKWYQNNFLIFTNKDKYQAMVIRESKPDDEEIEAKLLTLNLNRPAQENYY